MAHPFIEHVNLTVSDPERSAALMARIFGWHERWRGPARDGGMSIHVGSDEAYVALYTGPDGLHANTHFAKGEPLNHVGIQVDDLDATLGRVGEHGGRSVSDTFEDPAVGRMAVVADPSGATFGLIQPA